jgi:DNA-binding NtrC family response regulator
MRVGGDRYLPVDVRIIAATNKDLDDMVQQGLLREDLFYRLNVLPLHVPLLSEREGDALLIANTFLEQYNRMFCKQLRFSAEAESFILNYSWPGNVRQLRNHVERLVVTSKGKVIAGNSPEKLTCVPAKLASQEPVENNHEKSAIIHALNETGFNQKEAARKLGIDRSTLYRKMRKYNIEIKKLCTK